MSDHRYQAQAELVMDAHGEWSACVRVLDKEKLINALPETIVPLPKDQPREDFNPVAMLFDLGWIVETPYFEWERSLPSGGSYTHDVRRKESNQSIKKNRRRQSEKDE